MLSFMVGDDLSEKKQSIRLKQKVFQQKKNISFLNKAIF